MGKIGALRRLLNALSRLPGLGFLRGAASTAYEAERVVSNVDAAKKAASDLKPAEKKEETAKDENAPAGEMAKQSGEGEKSSDTEQKEGEDAQ